MEAHNQTTRLVASVMEREIREKLTWKIVCRFCERFKCAGKGYFWFETGLLKQFPGRERERAEGEGEHPSYVYAKLFSGPFLLRQCALCDTSFECSNFIMKRNYRVDLYVLVILYRWYWNYLVKSPRRSSCHLSVFIKVKVHQCLSIPIPSTFLLRLDKTWSETMSRHFIKNHVII